MEPPRRAGWLTASIVVGLSYAALGVLFAALAGPARSHPIRVAWRLAAWILSAALFLAHTGYESRQSGSSAVATALHVSLAAAFGAFVLAVAALVHSQMVPAQVALVNRLHLALAVWPLITGLPAFVVALALAVAIARVRQRG